MNIEENTNERIDMNIEENLNKQNVSLLKYFKVTFIDLNEKCIKLKIDYTQKLLNTIISISFLILYAPIVLLKSYPSIAKICAYSQKGIITILEKLYF